jgi:hypothetical protein
MIWRKTRLTPKILLVLALFILVSLAGVYFWQTKSYKEALEIEKVIVTFEEHKYQKDFVGAIKMLTPPQNQEEKGWLDHLLGNDLADINNGNPFPRFLNKVNFHLLVGYDIEKVTKRDNVFYARIKEHRILNMADEGAIPEYEAQTQDLTFELLNNGGNYEISKYYHTNPTSVTNLKYEGFVAF